MKDSLLIVSFFAVGLMLSYFNFIPEFFLATNFSTYILYLLMFVVGLSVGADKDSFRILFKANWKIVLVPMSVIVGSLASVAFLSIFINNISVKESLAVGAGFGYYSLSSILISEMHSETLGTVALLANIIREIITLLLAPLLVTVFGKLAPITAGGATSMDTTLPIITRASGNEYGVVSIFSGMVLNLLVAVIVNFILSF